MARTWKDLSTIEKIGTPIMIAITVAFGAFTLFAVFGLLVALR